MPAQGDIETIRAYRDRWRAVEAIEIAEQRAATVEQRWRQLNAIVGLAIGLGLRPAEDPHVHIARQRWAKLKGADHPEGIDQFIDTDPIYPRWRPKDGSIMTESGEIAHLVAALAAVQRFLARFNDQGIVIGG